MKKLFVLSIAALLLVAFSIPAMAATKTVTFYGNVRMWTAITKDSKEATATGYSDTDTWWGMDTANSRFGAKFKQGDISANVEIRPNNGSYYRQWWGAWNFGPGTILIGQTWSPLFLAGATSNSMDRYGLSGSYGDMWGSLRQPMIELTVPFSMGKFVLALVSPNTTTNTVGGTDQDTTLPKIETSLAFKLAPVSINLFFAYNKYDDVNSTDTEYDISSYIYGGKVSASFGPFSAAGLLWQGQNTKNYGLVGDALAYSGAWYNPTKDEIVDADVKGYFAEVGFKANQMLTVQVGYGYTDCERYQKEEDAQAMYYVRAPIQVAKGFTISPEIGKYDLKDKKNSSGTKTDKGKETYYGVYWQINF